MMRRVLVILGTVLLTFALVLAFLGHSDPAFVVAAAWIVILAGGLLYERLVRKPKSPLPPPP